MSGSGELSGKASPRRGADAAGLSASAEVCACSLGRGGSCRERGFILVSAD